MKGCHTYIRRAEVDQQFGSVFPIDSKVEANLILCPGPTAPVDSFQELSAIESDQGWE